VSRSQERSRPSYATMSQEELLALPVASWADERAHLYLWSTNLNLPDALELMEAWGFRFVTLLTWIKPSIGLGSYFRTTTEQVLFGVRGQLLTRARNIGTHFTAPKTFHSEKPACFMKWLSRLPTLPSLTFLLERGGRVGPLGETESHRRLRGAGPRGRSMTKAGDN
jgi:N6-adenosine-specific RNA methylase IME4